MASLGITPTHLMFLIGCVASVIIIFLIRKDPNHWGLKEPLKQFYWLPGLAPVVFVSIFLLFNQIEDMTYPTNLNIHNDVLVLNGVVETVRERPIDNVLESIYTDKTYFIDKNTGKELYRTVDFTPIYGMNDRMVAAVAFGYGIFDLKTGERLEAYSESEMKQRIEKAGVKPYSVSWSKGEVGLSVRSIYDKQFVYDPITNSFDPKGGNPLIRDSKASFPPVTVEPPLFDAQRVGVATDETWIVLNYEDLNRDVFILNAFDIEGALLWSKKDIEIDPSLKGEQFSYDGSTACTATDDEYFYFANKYHLVCISVRTGETKWIIEI